MDTDALQRLDSFLSDPHVPQEDKNRAVAMARTQEQSAPEESPVVPSDARARSGSYLAGKANQFVGALQGVGKDVENLVTGQPYGTGFPGERSGWDTAGDVATAAAPVVAPELTALGLGAGTLARGVGYSEPTADLLNAGSQLAVGGGQAILGAGKAVAGAPAALKAAARGKYAEAAAGGAGKLITLGTKGGNEFATDLHDAINWAGTHPIESKMVTPLLDKLTAPGSPGLSYEDLDNALIGLQKIRKPSYVRELVDTAAQDLLGNTTAGAARTAGKSLYKSLKTKPFKLAGGIGVGVAGGSMAAQDLAKGDYKKAALTLGATGLAGAGLSRLTGRGMAAAAGGAAGPFARTAVAVGGQIPGIAAGQGDQNAPAEPTAPDTAPAQPETAPSPTQALKPLPGPYGREIAAVASLVGIPPEVIQTHMMQESRGRPGQTSHPEADQAQTPAHGLMQITPGTFSSVAGQVHALTGQRPDLENPLHNILAGGLLLRKYLDKTNGDWDAASKMYFGGENPAGWGPRTEQYSRDIASRYAAEGG